MLWRPGCSPDPTGGAYSAPQAPTGFWGGKMGKEGEGRKEQEGGEGESEGPKGREKEREERGGSHTDQLCPPIL